ncbi:MAG TPA: hypothetical protein VEG25_00240 [Burkholderiales bacterium]|nr:hypothetical protein [Burkholderiales bacterium]
MSQQSTALFKNADLALASYATLGQGSTGARIGDLVGAGMTGKQATEFANLFPTVVTQFNDTPAEGGMGTSFSVLIKGTHTFILC